MELCRTICGLQAIVCLTLSETYMSKLLLTSIPVAYSSWPEPAVGSYLLKVVCSGPGRH